MYCVEQPHHPLFFFHHLEQRAQGRQRDAVGRRRVEQRCGAFDVKRLLPGQLFAA